MSDNRSLYDLKEDAIKNSHILLLIKNKRNVALLSKFLDGHYITHRDYQQNVKYDLILVDNYYYKTKFKLIEKIKQDQTPIFLPVILMHGREDAIDYSSKMMNIADEYILTPVKKDVLKERIKRMLKTRELTKDNYQINNRYKMIFDHLDDMMFIHQIDFEKRKLYPLTEINRKLIEKTGYKKEELLKMKITDLVYHDKKSHVFKFYFNKLNKDKEVLLDTALKRKDGNFINVEINSKIIEIDDKRYVLSVLKEL